MKKIIASLVFLVGVNSLYSQAEGSVFTSTGRGVSTTFATDYQALGINPANLAWSKKFHGKRIALGFMETGFSISSPILNNPVVNPKNAISFDFDFNKNATYQEFSSFAEDLQAGININADVRLFGIAVTTNIGGFGFSVSERYTMEAGISKDFSEIATFGFGASYFDTLQYVQGGTVNKVLNSPSTYDSLQADTGVDIISGISSNPKTIAQLFEGTRLKVSWIREYNFGFGMPILTTDKFGIYGGIGIKYLQGMALLDIEAANNDVNGFLAYSTTLGSSSFPGIYSVTSPQFTLPKAAGSGFGIDLGGNIRIGKKIKIGMSVTDIGSITWKENTHQVSADTLLKTFKLSGFYSKSDDFESPSGTATFDSILNNLVEVEAGKFERKITLPTTFRLGASFQFGKIVEIGGEIVAPMNDRPGSLDAALISLGGDIKLGPVVLSSGVLMQNNEVLRVPFGIVFAPLRRTYEFGISTRDMRGLVSFGKQENPLLSAAFGFLRFRI